jgi:hypothetical protein
MQQHCITPGVTFLQQLQPCDSPRQLQACLLLQLLVVRVLLLLLVVVVVLQLQLLLLLHVHMLVPVYTAAPAVAC